VVLNDKKEFIEGYDLNEFTKSASPYSGTSQAFTNAMFGLNPSSSGLLLDRDTGFKALVFFTRPQLHLGFENCVMSNELNKLLTTEKNSVFTYIRAMLDPRLYYSKENVKSDLVDPFNPFIPILTNTVTKISGWQDPVMDTKTTAEGNMKQQTVIADGTLELNRVFDLDMTFMNVKSTPVSSMLTVWLDYMDKVHKGQINPYIDMLIRREIDYMSRVYVIVLSGYGNKIKGIANTYAGFPITHNRAAFFDYDRFNQTQVPDITTRFKNVGIEYDSYSAMLDFNKLLAAFNPRFAKMIDGDPNHGLIRVPDSLTDFVGYRLYPYIDIYNNELVWYTNEEDFEITETGAEQ